MVKLNSDSIPLLSDEVLLNEVKKLIVTSMSEETEYRDFILNYDWSSHPDIKSFINSSHLSHSEEISICTMDGTCH